MQNDKKVVSDETKEKLRQANIGKNNPMYGKFGKDNPNYGRKATDEQKKNMSDKAKLNNAGSKNGKATEYHLTDPSGQLHIVIGGLENFCLEHNISERILRKYINKGIIPATTRNNATEKSINTYGWSFTKVGRVNLK